MNVLIKNGTIVNSDHSFIGDVYIENGKIKQVSENLDIEAEKTIDAKGKLVLPGGIDVHTHMSLDLGEYVSVDDFYTGTKAAAFGGTTTIVDHIGFLERGSSLLDMINHYHKIADKKAVVDYSFHGVIQEVRESDLDEIKSLHDGGITSLKMYTTYGGMLDDEEMLKVLKKAKETDTVVCVHCENDGMIKELREEAIKNDNLDPIYHAKTRPPETEAEAINRLAYLSELAGFPKLYIVHTSSKKGLEEIKLARKRGVKNLYCETCPQYLVLDENKYIDGGNEEGIKYIMAPPLRKSEDQEALWKGIKNKDVNVVATDHCPFYYKEDKLPHKDNFTTCPGGAPGVEERVEIILTEGLKRNIPIERLVEVLITNPSKIFGLDHKKGNIKEGLDGDIVIYNNSNYEIKFENRHSNCDYTSYEGFESDYKVDTVISKGKIILENNEFFGEQGDGEFISRK